MATRQNHTQRHQTIEDRLDALLDAEMARKARRSGCTDPRAYLRQQAAAKRREKRLAQQARRDAAWLVAQHVNTAGQPPARVEPAPIPVQFQLPAWCEITHQAARQHKLRTAARYMQRRHPGPFRLPPGDNPILLGAPAQPPALTVIDPATAHAIQQCKALVLEMKGWKAA